MNKRLILLRALAHKTGNLAQLRDTQPPKQGWIAAVRQALGMTAKQLAERVGLSQPRIAKMELNENIRGEALTLKDFAHLTGLLDF